MLTTAELLRSMVVHSILSGKPAGRSWRLEELTTYFGLSVSDLRPRLEELTAKGFLGTDRSLIPVGVKEKGFGPTTYSLTHEGVAICLRLPA